ncbi:outer membrane protein assembly factor BamE [Celerinatantimonas sp. YJH-8]|uniref:outer membrane protein assembly factor BamE n=1 Tax=Celerinatantimonas sp. YJH-8 TaxID=3228714 RepID=UPI0038BF8725
MRSRLILPALLSTVLLSGCSVFNSLVYQIDIPQGNFVEEKQVEQLRVHMTQEQVQFVMGTPMLVDAFTPNKWYYIYHFNKGNGPTTQKKLVLTFKNGLLQTMTGDYQPSPDFNTPINAPNSEAPQAAS